MTATAAVRPRPGGVALALRVTPRASKTVVGPVRDGRLIVRVTAPPVESAANEATVRALAEALGISRSSVQIVAGHASRQKVVHIAGMSAADVARALGLG